VLQSLLDSSMDSGVPFNLRLQQWFNESMDRATGSYRRTSHVVMFVVGLCLAVWLNVDTIRIATSLSLNPSLRTGLADKAAAYVEKEVERTATLRPMMTTTPLVDSSTPPVLSSQPMTSNEEIQARVALYNDALNNLQGLGLPIGWGKPEVVYVLAFFYLAIPGWLLTALAASLGANFWFQALGSLVRLRMTGQKPEDTSATPVLANAKPSPAMIPQPTQVPPAGSGLLDGINPQGS
jgi:hypothetical protein